MRTHNPAFLEEMRPVEDQLLAVKSSFPSEQAYEEELKRLNGRMGWLQRDPALWAQ